MTTDPSSPTRRARTTPIILAVVAAVIAVFVVLALLLTGGDEAGDSAGPQTTAAATGPVETAEPTNDETAPSATAAAVDPLNADITIDGEALAPLEDPVNDTAIGVTAPALTGTNYDGEAVNVTPGEDGPTMLVFLAHWCPHCNDEIPVLNEWRDAGGVPADLRVVGVSTAVAADRPNFPPGEWLVEKDWTWDVIADGPAASADEAPPALAAYGVTGFPFFVLLDADGNVAARGSGEQPIEVIEELVATVTDGAAG